MDRPSGTVTFLFTDIEGSTRLLSEIGVQRYRTVLDDHRRLMRTCIAEAGGFEVDTQGDAFFDLGYVVRIERGQTCIDGSPEPVPYALRVTMIIRQEGESWKVAHRHADPITAPRPLDTIAEGRG